MCGEGGGPGRFWVSPKAVASCWVARCSVGEPPLVGDWIISEARRDEDVAPVDLGSAELVEQSPDVAAADLQHREANPLQRGGGGSLVPRKLLGARLDQERLNRGAIRRGEEPSDSLPCGGAEGDGHRTRASHLWAIRAGRRRAARARPRWRSDSDSWASHGVVAEQLRDAELDHIERRGPDQLMALSGEHVQVALGLVTEDAQHP
jgi:hypothetical protein